MKLQRLSGLGGHAVRCLAATLGLSWVLTTMLSGHADSFGDGWEMIDEDELPVLVERSRLDELPMASTRSGSQSSGSQSSGSQFSGPQWSVEGDFLSLTRNDAINIRWSNGGMPAVTEFHSDSQLGFRFAATRADGPNPGRTETGVYQGSVLMVEDEHNYQFDFENFTVKSRLAIAEVNRGLQSEVFDVQTLMLLGARYVYLADEYDRYIGATLVNDDFVAARNHAGYVQGKLGGDWQRGRFGINASLAGGVGINAAHQEGVDFVLIGARYDSDRFSVSTLTEVIAKASYRLTHTEFHVGLYGLSLTELTTSRTGWGGEGDLDDARYFGLMIGAQHCF